MARTVSVHIRASPQTVWELTAERWGEVSRIVDRISSSKLDSGDRVVLGIERTCTLAEPVMGREAVREVMVAYEPPHRFAYEMLDPMFPLKRIGNEWTIRPEGDGTNLTLRPYAEGRGGPLGPLVARFVLWALLRDLGATIQQMRARLDAWAAAHEGRGAASAMPT